MNMIQHNWLQCRSSACKQKIIENALSKALWLRLKILWEYHEIVICQTRERNSCKQLPSRTRCDGCFSNRLLQKHDLGSHGFPAESQVLIGRFETACIPWIPLVAEFGTDHIEKAVFVTSSSIFSEIVGGMKLKFGEEIEIRKNSSIQIRRHSGEIFSIFALIPV